MAETFFRANLTLDPGATGTVQGTVVFERLIEDDGGVIHADYGDGPLGVAQGDESGVFVDGVLQWRDGTVGVPLLSNTEDLTVDGTLYYRARFNVHHVVQPGGQLQHLPVDDAIFPASVNTTPVNLIGYIGNAAVEAVTLSDLPVSGLSDASIFAKAFLTTVEDAEDALEVIQATRYLKPARSFESNGVDDTTTAQALLAEGAGEYIVRKGTTLVIDPNETTGMLEPQSNTRIVVEEGATVQVKANALDQYRLFQLDGVQNVTIEGMGTLLGDSLTHAISPTAQYGHLINITNGAANIQVLGPLLIKQAMADGVYIGGGLAAVPVDVLIDGVFVEDCRREGLAPFWVDGCTIRNCTIRDISDTSFHGPGVGIDAEPNDGQWVTDLTIENNLITGAAGAGIYCAPLPAGGTVPYITNLIIRGNRVYDCAVADLSDTVLRSGIRVTRLSGAKITDNVVKGTAVGTGIGTTLAYNVHVDDCTDVVVDGGLLTESAGAGVYVNESPNTVVKNVTIQDNVSRAVWIDTDSDGAVVVNNDILDNVTGNSAVGHVTVSACDNAIVAHNTFRGSSGTDGWVRTNATGSNHLVAHNTGVGAVPTIAWNDTSTNTVGVGNVRKDTGVYEAWTTTDKTATGTIELGHATDTTVARSAAGRATVEGAEIITATAAAAVTAKTTPVDDDVVVVFDSAASGVPKKTTWANIKTTLATWLETLTATWSNKTLSAIALTGIGNVAQSGTLAFHNQSDQTTNYERARHSWASDIYTIQTEQGGSGTARVISIQAASLGSVAIFPTTQTSTVGTVRLRANLSAANGTIAGVNGTLSASSGVQYGLAVSPTINQTSTAGYTAYLVNVTETGTGSGAKLLVDFQVGSVSKFKIDNAGVVSAVPSGAAGTVPVYAAVPSTASSTGVTGQIARDASHVYFCTATNTWVRAALATW